MNKSEHSKIEHIIPAPKHSITKLIDIFEMKTKNKSVKDMIQDYEAKLN